MVSHFSSFNRHHVVGLTIVNILFVRFAPVSSVPFLTMYFLKTHTFGLISGTLTDVTYPVSLLILSSYQLLSQSHKKSRAHSCLHSILCARLFLRLKRAVTGGENADMMSSGRDQMDTVFENNAYQ